MKKWATAVVAKNDKNGDMILQPEEQKALGSSAAVADLNHDGMITIDEIVMHHSAGADGRAARRSTSCLRDGFNRVVRIAGAASSDNRPKTDNASTNAY